MKFTVACVLLLSLAALPAAAQMELNPEDISWNTTDGIVRFQLHFFNPGPATSGPNTGEMHTQPYGAFADNLSLIGQFNVPPMQPNSFFDVFFDVPLADLPPSASERTSDKDLRDPTCGPDWHWDGNVDVLWTGPQGSGYAQAHYGTLQVCPGSGGSYIHTVTNCPSAASWSVTGLCGGFSAILVNEDLTPAPNPLPAGWTGHIGVSAAAGTALNLNCCLTVNFSCDGNVVPVTLCVTTCDCGPVGVEVTPWGTLKALYK